MTEPTIQQQVRKLVAKPALARQISVWANKYGSDLPSWAPPPPDCDITANATNGTATPNQGDDIPPLAPLFDLSRLALPVDIDVDALDAEGANPDALHQWTKGFGIGVQASFLEVNWDRGRPRQRDAVTVGADANVTGAPSPRTGAPGDDGDDELDGYEHLLEDYIGLRDHQNLAWADQNLAEGLNLEHRGHDQKALKCFSTSIEIFPKHLRAWVARSRLQLKLGANSEALDDLRHALDLDANDADVRDLVEQFGMSNTDFDAVALVASPIVTAALIPSADGDHMDLDEGDAAAPHLSDAKSMEDVRGPPATRPISRSSESVADGEDLMSSRFGPHETIVKTELDSMAVSACGGTSNGFPNPLGGSMDTPPALTTSRDARRRSALPHEVETAFRRQAEQRMDEPDGAPRDAGFPGTVSHPPRSDAPRSPRSRQSAPRSPREFDRPPRTSRGSPSLSRRSDRDRGRRPMDARYRSPDRGPVDPRWSPGSRPMDSIQSPSFRSINACDSPGRRRLANGHDSPRETLQNSRGSRRGDEGARKDRHYEDERGNHRRDRDENVSHYMPRGDERLRRPRLDEDERDTRRRTRDDDEGLNTRRGDDRPRRDRLDEGERDDRRRARDEDDREGRHRDRGDEHRYETRRDSQFVTRARPRPRSRSASPRPRPRTSPSPDARLSSRNNRADSPPRSSRAETGRPRSAERTRDSRRSARRPHSTARRSRSPGASGTSRMNDSRPRSPMRPPRSPATTRGHARGRSRPRPRTPVLDAYVPARLEQYLPPRSPSRHRRDSRGRRSTPPPTPPRRPPSPIPSRDQSGPRKDRPHSLPRRPTYSVSRSRSRSRSRSLSRSRSRSRSRSPRQHPPPRIDSQRSRDRDGDVRRRSLSRSQPPRQHLPPPRPESQRPHERASDTGHRPRSRSLSRPRSPQQRAPSRPESQRSPNRDIDAARRPRSRSRSPRQRPSSRPESRRSRDRGAQDGRPSRHGSNQARMPSASPRPRSRASRSRQQRSPSASSSVTLPSPEAMADPHVMPSRTERSPRTSALREDRSPRANVRAGSRSSEKRAGSRADARAGSRAATAPADRLNTAVDERQAEHAGADAMVVDPVPLDVTFADHGPLELPVAVVAPITVAPVSPRKEPTPVVAPVPAKDPMPIDKLVPADEPMQVNTPAPQVHVPRPPPPPIVWTGPDTVDPPQSKTSKSKLQRKSNTRAPPSSSSTTKPAAAATALRESKSSQRRRPRSPPVPRSQAVSQSPPPPPPPAPPNLDRRNSESGGTIFSRLSGSSRKRPAGDLRQTLTNHTHHQSRHTPEHDIDDFVDPDAVHAPAAKSRRSTFSNRMLGPVAPIRLNPPAALPSGRLPAPPPPPPAAPATSVGRVVVPSAAPALSTLAFGPQPRNTTPPPPPALKANPLKQFLMSSKMRK
ncbi:hypothetical protein AMAG_17694 [Allomyces macrogynus ATCC 38327]|uniref:Uncharacterized protein n=1 Tax=Allomyces macrogynus (strain ATCC 38327) TaxID=578462 RepID=A0A0L0RX22_ALLM3|nr:hypothetical protein AMAG_17694 [Allomyces macrogynus ATCC 38327]|eukprot:KNE54680.1 hypothetical protein AMAG_17694 [Allomyces macrogynus ATCC 38327]